MTASGLTPAAIATVRIEEGRAALGRVKARLGEDDAAVVVRAMEALGDTSEAYHLVLLLDRLTSQ